MATLLLGIVFLMTARPMLAGSLGVMAVAMALGMASGALVSRATRTRGQGLATLANGEREPLG